MKNTKLIAAICLAAFSIYSANAQTNTPAPKPSNGGRKVEKPPNFIPTKADPLTGDWQGSGGVVAQVVPTAEGKYAANILK